MAAPVLRPLATGEVLDVSFGLYRALFYPLVIVAAVSRAGPLLLSLYLQPSSRDSLAGLTVLLDRWPLWIALMVLTLIGTAFAVASTTSIVSAAYLGSTITPNAALARAARLIGKLIILSVLVGLSAALGFIVMIIPGMILLTGFAVSSVVLVLEQPVGPTKAMGRSWELTSGFRWKVFVTMLVAYLFLLIPQMAVGVASAVVTFGGTFPLWINTVLTGLLQIFVIPFLYVVITVLYYDLRVRKEGYDLELLAQTATHPVG